MIPVLEQGLIEAASNVHTDEDPVAFLAQYLRTAADVRDKKLEAVARIQEMDDDMYGIYAFKFLEPHSRSLLESKLFDTHQRHISAADVHAPFI